MAGHKIIPLTLALLCPTGLPLAQPAGDAGHGMEIWRYECAACHEMGAGAVDGIGPHLTGIFDRPAAAHDGFAYSDAIKAMAQDDLVWDAAALDAYLADPDGLIPGTRMGYPGLDDAQDRADLLAFLALQSDGTLTPPSASVLEIDLPDDVLAIQGDREWGEYLGSECLACHQASGAASGIPSITRWPEPRFVAAMHAYRAGQRPDPGMQGVARRLTDEDIAALAAYFGTIEND